MDGYNIDLDDPDAIRTARAFIAAQGSSDKDFRVLALGAAFREAVEGRDPVAAVELLGAAAAWAAFIARVLIFKIAEAMDGADPQTLLEDVYAAAWGQGPPETI